MKTILFIFSLLLLSTSHQAKNYFDVRSIIFDACPVQSAAINYGRINLYYKKVKKGKAKLLKSIQTSIYTTCYLRFSKHKVGMSFLLGHVGLVKSLDYSTVAYITALMNKNVLGKKQYVNIGKLWQKLESTGLDRGFIVEVIKLAKSKRYRGNSTVGFAYFYIEFRKQGMTHSAALYQASILGEKIKNYRSRSKISDKTFEIIQPLNNAKKLQTIALSTYYWKDKKNSMVELDKKEFNIINGRLDGKKIKNYINRFRSVRYLFGGRSLRYADSYYFINMVYKNQIPKIKLPNSAQGLLKIGKEIKKEDLKAGDIVFFANSYQQKTITHAALYIGGNQIAYMSAVGLTTARLDSKPYSMTFKQARRLIDATSE